jgi:hypothetical protein
MMYLLILMLYLKATATNTRLRAQISATAGVCGSKAKIHFRELQKHIVPGLCTEELFVSLDTIYILDAFFILKGYNGFRGKVSV